MASIILSGVLLDPASEFSVGDQIRFTHRSTTGETIAGAISNITIPPDGSYNIELQYGLILVEYKDVRDCYYRSRGVVTVNQDSTATTLPELLNAIVPPTDEQLLQFQAILADAVQAKNDAEAAADRAEAAADGTWVTEAGFQLQREANKRKYNGSGYLEWGKHNPAQAINQGLYGTDTVANTLYSGSGSEGASRTETPMALVDGVEHKVAFVNSSTSRNDIQFPEAEQGTRTYDSATGAVVDYLDTEPDLNSAVAAAFAAETATNKVIISRQDYVFLETFDQLISQYDIALPLGNVQYGATTDEDGLATTLITNLGVNQGYSAFGDWDTDTVGRGIRWSTMSAEDQKTFLSNSFNNVRMTKDGLVQRCYRVRVVRGYQDDWGTSRPEESTVLTRTVASNISDRVRPQGSSQISNSVGTSGEFFTGALSGSANLDAPHLWSSRNPVNDYTVYGLPIALVQRGNQGAYHPVYNPDGFARWIRTTSGGVNWYDPNINPPASRADAFKLGIEDGGGAGKVSNGNISTGVTGRSDQYEYYDAVYAGQVHDLRLTSHKLDSSRALEDSIRKDVAGTKRGKGKLVHSTVYDDAGSGTDANAANKWRLSGSDVFTLYADFAAKGLEAGSSQTLYVYDKTDDIIVRFTGVVVSGGQNIFLAGAQTSPNYEVIQGAIPLGSNGTGNEVYYILEKELTPEYDDLPWVDIIGDPERILATFPNGVVGQWVPEIPDGTRKEFEANRKWNEQYQRVYSNDDGASWTAGAWGTGNDTTKNLVGDSSISSAQVALYYYSSLSDFTEPSDNPVVYGELGDVFASAGHLVNEGNRLLPSLAGAIGKSDDAASSGRRVARIELNVANSGVLDTDTTNPNTHVPTALGSPANSSKAVKTLCGITSKDGLLYPVYWGREMVYDGDWGDTVTGTSTRLPYGSIPVVDNESTMTDLNGNTVKAFCHIGIEPIGIADTNEGVS